MWGFRCDWPHRQYRCPPPQRIKIFSEVATTHYYGGILSLESTAVRAAVLYRKIVILFYHYELGNPQEAAFERP